MSGKGLTPTEIREGMATCLRELQERIAADLSPGADERLANLITTYIDEEFNSHAKRVADNIGEAVDNCVTMKMSAAALDKQFVAAMASAAPTIAKAAARMAVQTIPLSVVMGGTGDFCYPEVGEQSIGQTMVLMSWEYVKMKEEMHKMREYVLATRNLLDEVLTVVTNDGGEVKVFTAGDPPAAFFSRRTDLEEAATVPADEDKKPSPRSTKKAAKKAAKAAKKVAEKVVQEAINTAIKNVKSDTQSERE